MLFEKAHTEQLAPCELFYRLAKGRVKTESNAVQGNHTAKVVIDHIIDESEYFIGIAQNILYEKQK